jgi:hypothetical protein
MKMFSKVLMLALCVTAMAFGAIIDDFSTPAGPLSDGDPAAVLPYGIIGGGLVVDKTFGDNSLFVDAAKSGGVFSVSTGFGTQGLGGAIYSGLWNLTATGQTMAIEMIYKDLAGGDIEFWISSDGGTTRASSGLLALPVAGPAMISVLVSSFGGLGGVSLDSINAVGFTAYTSLNQDLGFDNFQTYTIPEPGTYALMAAGLLGLFAIRRKRV